ncbi:MAG: flagellar export chaperone FlgN [Pirellulales bacterium]|nr:flagellar export chaperone FlgN [Pirellulales bacterium]
MSTAWKTELATFMTDLLDVQDETLGVLARRCALLGKADVEGLARLDEEEKRIVGKLQECLARREGLLAQAAQEGLPSDSIQSLSRALPKRERGDLPNQLKIAKARTRLLRHRSLTNWVIIQKTLLHLSQMLGIIATRGRGNPTYERGEPVATGSGSLVDQEA